MKKLTVLLVALVAVFMVSCSKKGSDKVIDLVNKTVEQLKQVKDAAGLEKVQADFAAEYEKVLCQDETCSFGWAIGLRVWIEMVLRSILYVFLIWVYSRSRTGCVEYPRLHQGNHR